MTTHRSEKDSMGAIDVPADKLWGAQTQRSLEHFRISTEKMPVSLIHALALTKRAAAKVNQDLGLLAAEKAKAIIDAADEVLAGKHPDEFPLAIWQTGPASCWAANVGWGVKCTRTTTSTRAKVRMMFSRRPCTWRR